MKILYALAFAPAFALSGCADLSIPLPGNVRPPELTSCGALELQGFVGGRLATLNAATRAQARIIRPGQPVSMDYNAARLNLDLDAGDTITRIWCG